MGDNNEENNLNGEEVSENATADETNVTEATENTDTETTEDKAEKSNKDFDRFDKYFSNKENKKYIIIAALCVLLIVAASVVIVLVFPNSGKLDNPYVKHETGFTMAKKEVATVKAESDTFGTESGTDVSNLVVEDPKDDKLDKQDLDTTSNDGPFTDVNPVIKDQVDNEPKVPTEVITNQPGNIEDYLDYPQIDNAPQTVPSNAPVDIPSNAPTINTDTSKPSEPEKPEDNPTEAPAPTNTNTPTPTVTPTNTNTPTPTMTNTPTPTPTTKAPPTKAPTVTKAPPTKAPTVTKSGDKKTPTPTNTDIPTPIVTEDPEPTETPITEEPEPTVTTEPETPEYHETISGGTRVSIVEENTNSTDTYYCALNISNEGDDISYWTITIEFDRGLKACDGYGDCDVKIDGKKLIIKPVSYNQYISAGGAISTSFQVTAYDGVPVIKNNPSVTASR